MEFPVHPWMPESEIPVSWKRSYPDIFIYSYGKIPGHEWKPESEIEEIKDPRWLHPYVLVGPSDDGPCPWKLGGPCNDDPDRFSMIEENMKCSMQYGERP